MPIVVEIADGEVLPRLCFGEHRSHVAGRATRLFKRAVAARPEERELELLDPGAGGGKEDQIVLAVPVEVGDERRQNGVVDAYRAHAGRRYTREVSMTVIDPETVRSVNRIARGDEQVDGMIAVEVENVEHAAGDVQADRREQHPSSIQPNGAAVDDVIEPVTIDISDQGPGPPAGGRRSGDALG